MPISGLSAKQTWGLNAVGLIANYGPPGIALAALSFPYKGGKSNAKAKPGKKRRKSR